MELSIVMRLRIAAAIVIGVALVGIAAWPWESPPDPFGSVVVKSIGVGGMITLLVMAFLAGFIAYFAAWPYGKEIGILAAPFGLAVWAVRCGTVTALFQANPDLEQRLELLSTLRLEPIFWLAVVLSGFGGVVLGRRIRPSSWEKESGQTINMNAYNYINLLVALVFTIVIAKYLINIFAQDVSLYDPRFNSVVSQPPVGQVVFSVFISFGIAAFVIKYFLKIGYIWPIIASSFVTGFSIITYDNEISFQYLIENWPATFYPDLVISVLPVQIVAFGTLGSIAGYWMAIRYNYWRKHELK